MCAISGSAGRREAAIMRGRAAAYYQDGEFFLFLRSQEAYGKTLVNDATVVLSGKDNPFLKTFA